MSVTDPWVAPTATQPVRGQVHLPGSKSVTNRALVLAALADGPSRLLRPLRARDTLLMAAGLRTMGADITDITDRVDTADITDITDRVDTAGPESAGWRVRPGPARGGAVDCGLAGTVARFLPPVAALTGAPVGFDGDPRMRERPMRPLLAALRELGAQVDADALPVTVRGPAPGGHVTVDASSSSQLLTGLLLIGAKLPNGLDVRHDGPPLVSAPHVSMTVAMLRESGVSVATEPGRWIVTAGPVRAVDRTVEPDLSSASAFLAAAVATGGEVVVPGWPATSTQPGAQLPELLTAMGASCVLSAAGLTVRGTGVVHGVDVDLRDVSELALSIAALAVLADGPSRLRGIAHMRLQEADRLAAFAAQLGRLGARVDVTDDGLAITPVPLTGGVTLDPHADHRLAMAYAIVGLTVRGVSVDDIATTGKTVPNFPALWAGLVT